MTVFATYLKIANASEPLSIKLLFLINESPISRYTPAARLSDWSMRRGHPVDIVRGALAYALCLRNTCVAGIFVSQGKLRRCARAFSRLRSRTRLTIRWLLINDGGS